MEEIEVPKMDIAVGNIKVMHLSGTSSFVVGTAFYHKQSSHAKTNNGTGTAYGDGSEINMIPYETVLYDQDILDTQADFKVKTEDLPNLR